MRGGRGSPHSAQELSQRRSSVADLLRQLKDHWILLLDLALLVTIVLILFTDQAVFFYHAVFALLIVGAFFWGLRAFVVRALFWGTVATAMLVTDLLGGRPLGLGEELLDVPLFAAIILAVFMIAKRRAEAQRKLRELFLSEQEQNRRLSELSSLKADFTAMVAHELSSPLHAIRRLSEVLRLEDLEPEARFRALEAIDTAIDTLYALIADMRAAAIVEREDFKAELLPVPVEKLLQEAAVFAAALPGNHPVKILREDSLEEGMEVLADRQRIGQVLRNLLSNAAKFSPEGEQIDLLVSHDDGRVRFEVADQGCGIRREDLSRIFEKFGRGRTAEGNPVGGVGLGLYLSRRIMRAHGSDLAVSSTPGEGSVFAFELVESEEVAR